MTPYRFVNTKGLFARPIWAAVMTTQTYADLKAWVDTGAPELLEVLPSTKLEQLKKALEIVSRIQKVPLKSVANTTDVIMDVGKNSQDFWTKINQSKEDLCFAVLALDSFTTSSGNVSQDRLPPNNQDKWGLEVAKELKPYLPVLKAGLDRLQAARTPPSVFTVYETPHSARKDPNRQYRFGSLFDESVLKKAIKLQEKVEKNEVSVKEDNPLNDIVQCDCFAIYIGGRAPGFLDGRGNLSPLAGARLFESQASAQKTITSRRLSDATIVHIGAHMKGLAPNQTVSSTMGPLQEAVAAMQKQAILDALSQATDEQLEEVMQSRRPSRKM